MHPSIAIKYWEQPLIRYTQMNSAAAALRRRLSLSRSLLHRLLSPSSFSSSSAAAESVPRSVPHPTKTAVAAKKTTIKPRIPPKLLFRHLMGLSPDGKVTDVFHYYIREGYSFTNADLHGCFRGLRKFRRYQHCYEVVYVIFALDLILQWMDKSRYNFSAQDHALRLDIVFKLKGVAEAEKYFDSLSPSLKNRFSYGVLLYCYCKSLMSDKAAALFKKMDELSLVSPLALNNLMTMSLNLGRPEKLPCLVQEMKDRNFPISDFSRALLMQACSMMNDIEGVERVFEETNKEKCDWSIYSNLASAYFKAGRFEKADSVLRQLEEILRKENRVRSAYLFLLTFHASVGDSDGVFRVWDSLKSHYPGCHNLSYLCLLSALSRLDDIEALTKYFGEWNTSCQAYDPRLAIVVLRSYLSNDMIDEAKLFFRIAGDKGGALCFKAHELFIDYYLEKGDIQSGLGHVEAAVSQVKKDLKWRPAQEVVESFFKYFEREKDVDGAERLCKLLRQVKCLDSKAFLSLLRIYVAAGKLDLEMRKRMKNAGIDISSEHKDLLDKMLIFIVDLVTDPSLDGRIEVGLFSLLPLRYCAVTYRRSSDQNLVCPAEEDERLHVPVKELMDWILALQDTLQKNLVNIQAWEGHPQRHRSTKGSFHFMVHSEKRTTPQNLECDELIVASSSKCKGILTGVMKINHGQAGMARW
ncbi:Pentatricopeptide repeat-containing protein [Drosera capensis]